MSEQQTTQITGAIIKRGDVQTFGANGFRKCEVVLETGGDYPQQIPVEFVKDKADKAAAELQVGDLVTVDYNLRGREYNGRYYTSVQGWKWTVNGGVNPAQTEAATGDDNDNQPF